MAQQIFKWRTRMAMFRANFSHGNLDLTCPLGCLHIDSQENVLKCKVIQDHIDVDINDINYFNIFSNNVQKVKLTIEVLQNTDKIRKEIEGPKMISKFTTSSFEKVMSNIYFFTILNLTNDKNTS